MAEGLINKFKENKDNIIGYSSLAGFVITFVYTCFAIYNQQWEVEFVTVVITLAIVNFLLVLTAIYSIRRYDKLLQEHSRADSVIKKLDRKIQKLSEDVVAEIEKEGIIATVFHNFCHEYRKVVSEITEDLTEKDYTSLEDRKSSFQRFLDYMVSNIKQTFDMITGDACSVCIKLLEQNKEGAWMVKTFIRDHISYRERSNTDTFLPEYNFQANTAFKNILDEYCPESFYMRNDLKSEYKNGHYNNANKNWDKFYNACLVVPIRRIIDKQNSTIVGFLCVDNQKGGFEDKIGLNTLASFGDLCYHLFISFNELKNNAENS
jgi:ABC-type multidrug transport system fused ATPase/permease subunit